MGNRLSKSCTIINRFVMRSHINQVKGHLTHFLKDDSPELVKPAFIDILSGSTFDFLQLQ